MYPGSAWNIPLKATTGRKHQRQPEPVPEYRGVGGVGGVGRVVAVSAAVGRLSLDARRGDELNMPEIAK